MKLRRRGRHESRDEDFAPRSPWVRVLVAVAAVELIVIVVLITWQDRPVREGLGQGSANAVEGEPYSNDRLGFALRHPYGWDIDESGSVTKLLSPGRDIALAVGPAPAGDVVVSSESLLAELHDRYGDVESRPPRVSHIDGDLAIEVEGRAVNGSGAVVRFSLIIVEGEAANYAITTFASLSLNRGHVRQRIHDVLATVEIGRST